MGWVARGHSPALQKQAQVYEDSGKTGSKAHCETDKSSAIDMKCATDVQGVIALTL